MSGRRHGTWNCTFLRIRPSDDPAAEMIDKRLTMNIRLWSLTVAWLLFAACSDRNAELAPDYFSGEIAGTSDSLVFRDCATSVDYLLSEKGAYRAVAARYGRLAGPRRRVYLACRAHLDSDTVSAGSAVRREIGRTAAARGLSDRVRRGGRMRLAVSAVGRVRVRRSSAQAGAAPSSRPDFPADPFRRRDRIAHDRLLGTGFGAGTAARLRGR